MTVRISNDGPIAELRIFHAEHTVHWEVGRDRNTCASVEFKSHRAKPWLSIDAHEQGRKSSKRTMVTLDENETRQLYSWLKSILEPDAEAFVLPGCRHSACPTPSTCQAREACEDSHDT